MRVPSSAVACLAAVLASIAPVVGQLSKPVMNPPVPFSDLDPILFKYLKSTPHNRDQWGWGWLPARCKAIADQQGLNAYDIDVYNVHYNDCNQAWVMCRHHLSPLSIDTMAENFGRIPVRMRNFVRVQFALPQKDSSFGGATFSDLGDILWYGDVSKTLRFWIHEAGHAIDRNINPGSNDDYSRSSAWLNEYNKDGFICDDYAKNNAAENFAQEVIVALFDKVVPNGLGSVSPNWNSIFHQYATVQSKLGDILIPGGTCNRKFADDTIVCMGPAANCNSKANAKFRLKADKTQDAAIVAASDNPPIEDLFEVEE
ncbi:hypothetical protein BKA59DRAFT_449949 [Fusarium tricinctum]|uniref:Conidiation-specific protein 13 n=1 Tax=Fusarium tricinctum TaxID=61284 RepID=A0A8K0SBP1_9HYPO|nr:hypothetical protein BKA59DRAFT_449949 [Fusarium tricinctum]